MLACVNADNEFCQMADANQHFAINILATEHTDLSTVFAGLGADPEADRFASGQWTTLKTGSPVLSNALVSLDCELPSPGTQHGTHKIYIGNVIALNSNDAAALVYAQRAYAKTTPL